MCCSVRDSEITTAWFWFSLTTITVLVFNLSCLEEYLNKVTFKIARSGEKFIVLLRDVSKHIS